MLFTQNQTNIPAGCSGTCLQSKHSKRLRQENLKFKAILGYIVSSKLARATSILSEGKKEKSRSRMCKFFRVLETGSYAKVGLEFLILLPLPAES